MFTNDLLYQLALTQVPQVGDIQARLLVQRFGSAEAVFKARKHQLETMEGIGSIRAENICRFSNFAPAAAEINFLERYQIQPLFLPRPATRKGCCNVPMHPCCFFTKAQPTSMHPRFWP
ncbi:Helix-hairpin-helix motif-containing protein [Cnuella takakiae]|uniref:Helix-hairpin-helix motif-containing protein n=1 Tax=Cnuella takakiae TaxID=1302690 RepID=A0A1M5C1V3_9BACT|nr:helix-hairpin-helix domain-containing protein [Cnuella takakiae]SHF48774.1 Helix-hairpin-helix motif-containing protein [Cnuella takakiae]